MAKYQHIETMACWVTFVREIEASDEEIAWREFNDGGGELVDTQIGDILDYAGCTVEIIKLEK